MAKSDDEWNRRVLCSDGNCIGIIGPDGRCKACGEPYQGELPSPAAGSDALENGVGGASADQEIADAPVHTDDDAPVSPEAGDDDWEERTLCSDESCIGVVGPDGRCKECGKSASP